ncbi:hypothetical protein DQQ01_11595 [Blautia argi]|uniref:Uncharacterized protein n=1 Tax=Blautia argi TaxID=1912897 RepID=A0A2Z4UCM7_9FIRM|nr:hypothetical protein DQQ01_11595 [Blautia argi]
MSRGERGISLFSTAKELKDCRKKRGRQHFFCHPLDYLPAKISMAVNVGTWGCSFCCLTGSAGFAI